ncbi:STAS domain-containing protein [bacterium]|nr:STAS domain-containing protein [bacterium]
MNIVKNLEGNDLMISLDGRLDTISSAEVEKSVKGSLKSGYNLILDCSKLVFLTSSGLRAILSIQKEVYANGGKMVLRKVNPDIMNIFEMTGFSNILIIEN